jgi:predicted O-methyltransferase YrrM
MSEQPWAEVDGYLESVLVEEDPVLEEALLASRSAGLPQISVSPLQGKFLHVLACLVGARKVLEIGTLGGYSTIWLARALAPGGKVVSLELEPRHAEVARANLARAGLSDAVEVVVGPAAESLPRLAGPGGPAPFDLTFIDADKPGNPEYFRWALQLTRPGGAIVVDNVVRNGLVADGGSTDPTVVGTRKLFESLAAEGAVVASALQTVGCKGYDGFVIAFVAPGRQAAPVGG